MKLISARFWHLTLAATALVPGATLLNGCSGGNGGNDNGGSATPTPTTVGTATPTPTTPGTATPTPSATRAATPVPTVRPNPTATPVPTVRPVPTATSVPTPTTFAGNYAGGLRLNSNGVTSSFTFRVNANGSITNTTSGDSNVFTGSVSSTGALRFTTSDADFGNVVATAQLSRNGTAVTGSGSLTTSREGNGSLRVRSATPASAFAGTYRGNSIITAGDDRGDTFPTRLTVDSNGIVEILDESDPGSEAEPTNLINSNGSFQLGLEENEDDVISIIEGTVSGNRATGTIRNNEGFRATFTLQR